MCLLLVNSPAEAVFFSNTTITRKTHTIMDMRFISNDETPSTYNCFVEYIYMQVCVSTYVHNILCPHGSVYFSYPQLEHLCIEDTKENFL